MFCTCYLKHHICTLYIALRLFNMVPAHMLLSPAAPKARDGRYCNAPRPSVCPSVRHVQFSHCNSKTHCCIFSKLCRYVHQVMGVCCIVFDIDGMLFEFFMNFLNIEKKYIFMNFFSKFHGFFTFHAISNIKKINSGGGGGGC